MDLLKLAEHLSRRLASETESAEILTEMTDKVQLIASGIRVGLKISLSNVADGSTPKILRISREISVKMISKENENT